MKTLLFLFTAIAAYGQVKTSGGLIPPSYTIATLPATPPTGTIVVVTDAPTAGSCTGSPGSATALCRYTGSAWASIGDGGSGSASTADDIVVTYSTTPTFNVPVGSLVSTFRFTFDSPGANVTASTLQTTGAAALVKGQTIKLVICQGTTVRTFAFPSNVSGFSPIAALASVCTTQEGSVNAALNLVATGPAFYSNVSGAEFLLGLKGTAPTGAVPSGYLALYPGTDDAWHALTSGGTDTALGAGSGGLWSLNLPAGTCDNAGASMITAWNIVVVANPATRDSCSGTDTDLAILRMGNTGSPAITRDFIFSSPWASGSATNMDIWVYQTTGAGDVKFTAKIGCMADGDTGINFTYNATANATVTFASAGPVKKMTITSIPTSGSSTCAVGSSAMVKVERDNTIGGSNLAGNALIIRARLYQ